jgi:anti-sigma regulatory factor (Ser/Thr protein kinase)
VVDRADDREPDVRYEFGHDRRAASGARRQVDDMLSEPDDPIADDVRLATSELVSNVLRHTADGGELRAWDPRPDVPVRLEVEDADPTLPQIPDESPAIGGRGLRIVEAVADAWGVEQRPTRKIVVAEFDRDQRDGIPAADDDDG